VNLGLLHPTLPLFIVEKGEHGIERLFGIVQYVSERPSLAVLKEILTGDNYSSHSQPLPHRLFALVTSTSGARNRGSSSFRHFSRTDSNAVPGVSVS
jgi:hypothetical protein